MIIQPMLLELAGMYGGEMYGLNHRFKDIHGIGGKIKRILKNKYKNPDGKMTIIEASNKIRDALRYTIVIPWENYNVAVYNIFNEFHRMKYTYKSAWLKNRWNIGDGYQGVNSSWTTPDKLVTFEVQFHTHESLDAKRGKNQYINRKLHDYYKYLREPSNECPQLDDYNGLITDVDINEFADSKPLCAQYWRALISVEKSIPQALRKENIHIKNPFNWVPPQMRTKDEYTPIDMEEVESIIPSPKKFS